MFLVLARFGLACGSEPPREPHVHEAPAPAHDHPAHVAPAAPAALPPAANPVQEEMRALHAATRDWVTAIANHQLDTIPPSLGVIHAARSRTEAALAAGAYAPPKNPSDLAGFVAQDEAFHGELVKLLRAAEANDLPAATRQLGVVLDGCTACHQKFRF